jgi:hypothetical protein
VTEQAAPPTVATVKGEEYRSVRVRVMECEVDGCSLREAGRITAEEGWAGQGNTGRFLYSGTYYSPPHPFYKEILFNSQFRSLDSSSFYCTSLYFTPLHSTPLHSTPLHHHSFSFPFHSCYFTSFNVTSLPFPSISFLSLFMNIPYPLLQSHLSEA